MPKYDLNQFVLHIHFTLDKVTYPGWKDVRNLVNVHSLYWIHEGEGSFYTNTEHKVKKGMMVYLRPGLQMSMRSEIHAPLRMTMVLFDCAELNYDVVWKDVKRVAKLSLPFLNQYNCKQAEELGMLFEEIHQEWMPGVAHGAAVSQGKLKVMLHKLHNMEQPDWSINESSTLSAFNKIKKYMENGYQDNIKVEQLAKQYSISATYLRKLFLKYTGMGPKEYLSYIRNERACSYLIYTDYQIKEIARLCGYFEEYHFSKMFKQLNDLSPSSYRKIHKKIE